MAPSKSELWNYFQKLTDTSAQCNLCNQIIKTSGNITNLKAHINTKHKDIDLQKNKLNFDKIVDPGKCEN